MWPSSGSKLLTYNSLCSYPNVVLAGQSQQGGLAQDHLGFLLGAVQQEYPAFCSFYLEHCLEVSSDLKVFNELIIHLKEKLFAFSQFSTYYATIMLRF
jgi:hypothetical protein